MRFNTNIVSECIIVVLNDYFLLTPVHHYESVKILNVLSKLIFQPYNSLKQDSYGVPETNTLSYLAQERTSWNTKNRDKSIVYIYIGYCDKLCQKTWDFCFTWSRSSQHSRDGDPFMSCCVWFVKMDELECRAVINFFILDV